MVNKEELLPDKANRRCPLHPKEILELLGIHARNSDRFLESLPFSLNDITAGSENELQAVVEGMNNNVDLPITIERSNYFSSIRKRAASGEAPKGVITDLEKFLNENTENVWENSWVRFPRRTLCQFANSVFTIDLRANKNDPCAGLRTDADQFIFYEYGEEFIRIPVSYLLKLSLADAIGSKGAIPKLVRRTGERVLRHFLNDNISPETFSLYVVPLRPDTGMGRAIARETSKRYLLTQLLTMYANNKFLLQARGQNVKIYFSARPPIRQKRLNKIIPDSFYRELFINPCLSGWNVGEAKYNYMHLCHQVLSRSLRTAMGKLHKANIIASYTAVLSNTSNISLANNGTHLSLGSVRLSSYLREDVSGFARLYEKHLGDLVIKIVEHFLPLFVGTYSAAPYRMDFTDFRPEKALGFLPHELDCMHLQMIWRKWKKKAHVKFLGKPITPFGPPWLGRTIRNILRLKGDFVPDFRLVDYFMSLLSTDRSPVLDGTLGNDARLKKDLADLEIFDVRMSSYLLYRLREFNTMGFSGFEGRYYSLFLSLEDDMGRAADLQTLVNALAFKYIAEGDVTHFHIPDDPTIESERRQIFFGAAIGIPTFYILKNTSNLFLKKIVTQTNMIHHSRRFPGYLQICHVEYCRALAKILQKDAVDLIEMLNLKETMEDLQQRLENPGRYSVTGKLTREILNELNAHSPIDIMANEFNLAAERYYRDSLRKHHVAESFRILKEDFDKRCATSSCDEANDHQEAIQDILQNRNMQKFLTAVRNDVMNEVASEDDLRRLIHLMLINIDYDMRQTEMVKNIS
ncbi:MAG: hypothetical protein HRU72_04595 [Planctomycetia bacterium]|nr:hypothetical protein [Candidatus Brocadia sp.]MDG6004514.1 hypothetical protein [Candidatus Brocadia sp.]QOJ05879.1 MAG: hypothetical protein HRU72_04595 [Planctomycetia bacterium]TVL95315.1 MAG: hypothetical protein CV082_11290 [Candidatus Brocadia sp. BL1]HQU32362.1 hypothetical protein [Candidatus Brocadia sapporoensis]